MSITEHDDDCGARIERPRISPARMFASALSCLLALFFSYLLVSESPRDFRRESPHLSHFWSNLVIFTCGAFSFWMITIGLPRHSKWQLWCGVSGIIIGTAIWVTLVYLL